MHYFEMFLRGSLFPLNIHVFILLCKTVQWMGERGKTVLHTRFIPAEGMGKYRRWRKA